MSLGYRTARIFLLIAAVSAATGLSAQAKKELHVSAATDMHPVFDIVGPMFEKKTGIHLVMSYGASATLSHQILSGTPADIFFSADYVYAERIVSADLADSRDAIPYAMGTLVLWSRKGSKFYPPSMEMLEGNDLKAIAIENADIAPYGRAAESALRKIKRYDALKPKLVQVEDGVKAAQLVQSGKADVALMSLTIASSHAFRNAGGYVLVSTYTYPQIRQCAVILKKSPHLDAAHTLLSYMLSPEIQTNLDKVGLKPAQ